MRQLLPDPSPEADLVAVYGGPRAPRPGRPWLLANMIASADGSAALEGRSGGLGGPADRQVFHLLRSLADVVLVAAETVRVERYRPIREPRPVPLAVVSRSLALDLTQPLFAEAPARTIILTCEAADPGRRRQVAAVADVVVAGDEAVDPVLGLAALAERGHEVALCEGGPGLLAQLVAAGLVDELCLTVSPLLAGGGGPRILSGTVPAAPVRLVLDAALEDEGFLLLRYLIARAEPSAGTDVGG